MPFGEEFGLYVLLYESLVCVLDGVRIGLQTGLIKFQVYHRCRIFNLLCLQFFNAEIIQIFENPY